MYPTPRDAATVVLLRPRGDTYEVFLLRRRRGASFMASAFVFPGGAADPGEDDPRVTAARELFEEAGVLLVRDAPLDALAELRARVHDGASLATLLAERGLALDLDALHYYAHWITPSAEPKRFNARFYVAILPAGQTPRFDDRETVDEVWVTPDEALARSAELMLPPPQVRTFLELSGCRTLTRAGAGPATKEPGAPGASGSIDDVLALCARRAACPHPVMPRLAPAGGGFTLLLPWDPEYATAGTGDAAPIPDHDCPAMLAGGPTRFVLEDRAWRHLHAPTSTVAGS